MARKPKPKPKSKAKDPSIVAREKPDSLAKKYPPGQLCAKVIHATEPVECTKEEINELREIFRKIDTHEMPARREEVIRIWEARLFDRGYQHLLPRRNGGWTLPMFGSGFNPGDQYERSMFEANFYTSYRRIYTAALTREVPAVRFEPKNPDADPDITAADTAEKLKKAVERNNAMMTLQAEQARFLWTDGCNIRIVQFVKDAQRFGYEEDDEDDEVVPETESGGMPLLPSGDGEQSERANPPESADAESGTSKEPKGREVITNYGKLSVKMPMKANSRAECFYLKLSREFDVCEAKAMYPDIAEDIHPGQGGPEGDDIDRLARVNVLLGVEQNFITTDSQERDVTIQDGWLRPAVFMSARKEVKESLLTKFPNGCFATFVGDEFAEAYNESMDDPVSITFADAGDGSHRPGAGQFIIPLQKVFNNWLELANDYFIRGVPQKWMDNETFDVEKIRDQTNIPGGIRPFQWDASKGNGDVNQLIFEEQPISFPEQLFQFISYFKGELAQFLCGVSDAMYAGDSMSADASGVALAIKRDLALGVIGLPWRNIKESQAECMLQAVQCIAKARKYEGRIRVPGEEKVFAELADLKGNCLAFPETDENFPESPTQKTNRIAQMVTDAATNPMFQQIIDDPNNLELIKNALGLEELTIPMLQSRDKQLGELVLLLREPPMPNPQIAQMGQQLQQLQEQQLTMTAQAVMTQDPNAAMQLQAVAQQIQQLQQQMQELEQTQPLVSSVEIDPEFDDNSTELLTCISVMMSPRGRALKDGDEEEKSGYMNLRLHALEHKAAMKAQAAQATAPPKPLSLSANAKDMPPKIAAEMLTTGGIPATAQDFVEQDAAEAAEKHPGPGGITVGQPQ